VQQRVRAVTLVGAGTHHNVMRGLGTGMCMHACNVWLGVQQRQPIQAFVKIQQHASLQDSAKVHCQANAQALVHPPADPFKLRGFRQAAQVNPAPDVVCVQH
jgi:hypothetical protein